VLSVRTIKALEGIRKASKNGFQAKHLFKIMTNHPDLWLMAYSNIYANKGALTKGVNNNTMDGMSQDRLTNLTKILKEKKYLPTPVKRVYIPKANGKKRPLGILTGDDKLVQEVVRIILENIYELEFSDYSHGFRPGKSCHTALTFIQKYWKGTKWIIDMDIKGYFDNIDHDRLIQILEKKIKDRRFIGLIKMMLKAGYLEDWKYHKTYSGTPQGGLVSPILANIYLHELDKFLEKKMDEFNGGKRMKNPEYVSLAGKIYGLRKKIDRIGEGNPVQVKAILERIGTLDKRRKKLPSFKPGDFRRLKYIRYADDFVIGITGTRAEAQVIMNEVKYFVNKKLKLEVAEEKTGLQHSSDETNFLGYTFKTRKAVKEVKVVITYKANGKKSYGKRRTISDAIHLCVPKSKVDNFCRKYTKNNKSVARPELLNNSDAEIISTFNAELRGVANYYALTSKCYIRKVEHFALESLFKTLAGKNKLSVKKIRRKLKQGKEHVLYYAANEKKKVLKVYKLKHRVKKPEGNVDQKPNIRVYGGRTELIERLNANRCEYCGTTGGYFEVHHIRKLSDIKEGKKGWQKHMIARNRKTLILCIECHHLLHAGKLSAWRKDLHTKVESVVH